MPGASVSSVFLTSEMTSLLLMISIVPLEQIPSTLTFPPSMTMLLSFPSAQRPSSVSPSVVKVPVIVIFPFARTPTASESEPVTFAVPSHVNDASVEKPVLSSVSTYTVQFSRIKMFFLARTPVLGPLNVRVPVPMNSTPLDFTEKPQWP